MSVPSISFSNYPTDTGASVTSISWSHVLLFGESKKVFVVFILDDGGRRWK